MPTPPVEPGGDRSIGEGPPEVSALVEAARAAGESAAGWWLELATAAETALTSQSLDLITSTSLSKLREALNADAISLLVASEDESELVARAAIGLVQEVSVGLRIRSGEGMAGHVLKTRRPLIVPDLSAWQLASPTLRESGMRSVVAVPIIFQGRVLGVLHAGSRTEDRFVPEEAELLSLVAERLAPAIARVARFQAERAARRGAEDRLRQLSRLQGVVAALGEAADLVSLAEGLVAVLDELPAGSQRQWSSVWLLSEGRLVKAAGTMAVEVAELSLDDPFALCESVRTRRPIFASSAFELEARLPDLSPLQPPEQSLAVLPLTAGTELLGALRVTSSSIGAFGASERELLSLVAEHAGQAIARAWADEQRERVARLSGFLADASRITAEAPDFASALNRLADLALTVIGDICLIDVAGEEGGVERVAARHRDAGSQVLVDRLRADFPPSISGSHPAVTAIRSGRPSWSEVMGDEYLQATTRSEEHYRLVSALGFRSFLTVPLTAQDVVGAVTFVYTARSFEERDVDFAKELAAQVSAVVGNVHRYEATLRTSLVLQQALLPRVLPEVPGTEIHSRYLAATGSIDVGGDFFDVTLHEDGAADFVIGDVAGHGREAAAMMGQLRSAMRALGLKAAGPAEVVGALHAGWDQLGFDRMVTTLLIRYWSVSRRLSAVSAGHYPPLLIGEGTPRFLGVPPNPPFGAPAGEIVEWSGTAAPDDVLLLYTDGIIDDQHLGIDASMRQLAEVAAAGPRSPREVCDRIIAEVGRDHNDDLALLAVRFR